MSMSLLTLLQFFETLAAYLFVTLALPCAFLNKHLSQYRFAHRVLLYFIIGNFYAANLVFLLQLLHISNFFTLWIGLLAVPAVIWERVNQFPILDKLRSLRRSGLKLLIGTLGIKSAIDGLWRKVRGFFIGGLKKAGKYWLDWLLILALCLMVMWVYGIRMLREFGYAASDIPTHMYWVNGLSENRLFVSGIYPEGMHVILYLLNELFGIDTYVVFRVFALVQCLAIHMMALLFLKLCCKSRYAAYTGVFLYTIGNYFHSGSYLATENLIRYLSTMPQETSMIYILPTVYFVFYFFQEKRKEIKEFKESERLKESEESGGPEEPGEPEGSGKRKKFGKFIKTKKKIPAKSSRLALAGLAMSFSLCVSAHFYGAIIAVLFCFGVAVGYLVWIVRPAYLKWIIAAGLISLAVAVLPMGIAFAMGTPLQGSLNWATGVITSNLPQQGAQAPELSARPEDTQNAGAEAATPPAGGQGGAPAAESAASPPESGRLETIMESIKRVLMDVRNVSMDLWNATGERIESITLRRDELFWCSLVMRGMIVFLIAAGAVLLLSPARMYGAILLSTGTFMLLMSAMFAGAKIGFPALMEADRTNLFYGYMMTVVVGFTVDACVFVVTCLFKSRLPRDILSFAAVAALMVFTWRQGMIRPPLTAAGLETNEAITCLTNIIATEKDYSWTIFSANDETHMVFGHGYHYEPVTFLQEIKALSNNTVTVPTETVYFFIEKLPLEYWAFKFDQPISREGAERPVPRGTGIDCYKGESRWIVMSHMYYWAQAFQRLYPNEMTVYLETDNFICYRLEQNPYRLYDLAIDYGYNTVRPEEL